MKIFKFLYARLITWKYRFHWEDIKNTKWPKIWWSKTFQKFIVFCPECGHYICNDGTCSNPFCLERLNDEN